MGLKLDHIAITAGRLEDGVAFVEEALGVALAGGGRHPKMGTHNRLLRLGADRYLEVITADPNGTAPSQPRWFGLDEIRDRVPGLSSWVALSQDIDRDIARLPVDPAPVWDMDRGDLSWKITIAEDGRPLWDGAAPALIQWPQGRHPAPTLPDAGCALVRLTVRHPRALELADHIDDPLVGFETSRTTSLSAEISTPTGVVAL